MDATAILNLWTKACQSTWNNAAVWVHGDVAAGNLLCADGKLSAVIDFGNCGVGDPACDLTMAWTVFDAQARQVFKDTLDLDSDTWDRAAGWCVWKALLNACNGAQGGADVLKTVLADAQNS